MTIGWAIPQKGDATWMEQDWLDDFWSGAIASGYRRPDPYLRWSALTRFTDAGGLTDSDNWVAIILELDVPAINFAEKVKTKSWIKIDALYTAPPAALKSARYCTAIVRRGFFAALKNNSDGLKDIVRRFELVFALVPKDLSSMDAQDFQLASQAFKRASAPLTCVVGIIDDGIAFAHERFRSGAFPATTRIGAFWNQGIFSAKTATPLYGRELSNADINSLLQKEPDEDAVYRAANYAEVRRRFAHGTFVLDTAAGFDPATLPDKAPAIVAVQLQSPSRRTRDRATGWLNARTLDGLRYILDRAAKINHDGVTIPPVVVNLSYGLSAGPHDGSSMLEQAMDEVITLCRMAGSPLEIVVAAGNSNLRRSHVQSMELQHNSEKMFCWRTLPDDPTPNFMEIWISGLPSSGHPTDVLLDIAHSSNTLQLNAVRIGETHVLKSGNDVLFTITSSRQVATGDRCMFLLALAPTASSNSGRALAKVGTWDIGVRNFSGRPIDVHAWIQRDETPYTFPLFGRQSRVSDKNYIAMDRQGHAADIDPDIKATLAVAPDAQHLIVVENYKDAYLYRKNTLNSIATGEHTVVVGGYRRSDGVAARYSSSSPKLEKNGAESPLPGLIALGVSDDSPSAYGILGAGSRSGSTVIVDGTSVAAPQIARRIASYIQHGLITASISGREIMGMEADIQEGRIPGLAGNPDFQLPGYKFRPLEIRGGRGRIDPEFTAVAGRIPPPQRSFESGFGKKPR